MKTHKPDQCEVVKEVVKMLEQEYAGLEDDYDKRL